jgi:hypothetical protein
VTRTTVYLPTRLQRPEGSLLLFRIELADGSCAFRGEGTIESYRLTPGGEQLGMVLKLRRLDKASKELHTSSFAGAQESEPLAAERRDTTADLGSLAAAMLAAADAAFEEIASAPSASAEALREPVVVSRNEDDAPTRMRDDLRAPSRSAQEAVTRLVDAPAQTSVDSEDAEQPQSVGRMAVARMSVDEYEARKLAMARVAAPPPVASLVASSESSAAWSEADDALDFEGIGSDLRPSLAVAAEPEPVRAAPMVEAPLPPSPTLPPLEGIVVAPPQDAIGGGVTLDEVTFSGPSAYEMPVAAPLDAAPDLDLDFDFTAVTFAVDGPTVAALSGSRAALLSGSRAAVSRTAAEPIPDATLARREAEPIVAAATEQRGTELSPRAAATPPSAVPAGPSRLPPAPPPKSGALGGVTSGAAAARSPVQMSKPIPKPTPAAPEEKQGLFDWLRGKK